MPLCYLRVFVVIFVFGLSKVVRLQPKKRAPT